MEKIIIVCYIFGILGFSLAGATMLLFVETIGQQSLTHIGHFIGFIGFMLFGITMFSMATNFKNLSQIEKAVV